MAKPRVFISSTYFDFKNVRDDLDRFVRSLGYETVRHEVGQVPYERSQKLDSSCYKGRLQKLSATRLLGGCRSRVQHGY
ncbi:MAG: DUF4062 domain-containing protein [Gammaproteobacteria bacterium]|nr:DUF4062 domain-containing protein [Gammaproteobacteria bacterium]MBU0883750.1 DUF4062 domain-containing protein [Gammaproteobacteria bacterium]MBU1861959.1 DUF4062 domain-containing protein [Gammaproteobacteria bacterium]